MSLINPLPSITLETHENGQSIIPDIGFVRLPVILSIIPVSESTWWAGVRSGRFPKPVKLGEKITAWRVEDIHTLIAKISADGT